MKTFLWTSCLLVAIAGLIILQSVKMHHFKDEIFELLPKLEQAYESNDEAKFDLAAEALQKSWEKNHLWFSITVDSLSIEDIEMSIKRIVKYGRLGDSFDFYAEKINLEGMITRLPRKEGAYLKELL